MPGVVRFVFILIVALGVGAQSMRPASLPNPGHDVHPAAASHPAGQDSQALLGAHGAELPRLIKTTANSQVVAEAATLAGAAVPGRPGRPTPAPSEDRSLQSQHVLLRV